MDSGNDRSNAPPRRSSSLHKPVNRSSRFWSLDETGPELWPKELRTRHTADSTARTSESRASRDFSTMPNLGASEGSKKGVPASRSIMKAEAGRSSVDKSASSLGRQSPEDQERLIEVHAGNVSASNLPYPHLPPLWHKHETDRSLILGATHRCSYPLRRLSTDNDANASTTAVHTRRIEVPSSFATMPMSVFPLRRALPAPRGTRVELHVHLAGALRPATIWEFMKDKKMKLPGDGSLRALIRSMATEDPVDVYQFAKNVVVFLPAIAGDLYALERVAFELCEDKVKDGVLYMEVRYTPNLLLPMGEKQGLRVQLKLEDVVAALNRGFDIAQAELGITVRTLLSITIGVGPPTEIFNLAREFQDKGVVGLDFSITYIEKQKDTEEVPLLREVMKIFSKACQVNLHRTAHAGFLGGANMVQRAVEKYHAERIGHGYGVLEDMNVYKKCLAKNIHFECCPWESILILNGPQIIGASKHPITRFAEDGANFSISSSHPSITGRTLQHEYDLAGIWGFTEFHLVRSNINALQSCFASDKMKKVLMKELLHNLGLQ